MTNDGVTRFFDFARERHSIYLRRFVAKEDRPWTQDPILEKYRFTNVFRELDQTTVWFRENVRGPLADKPEVLLATVIFRWFNRIATGERIFKHATGVSGSTAWDLRDHADFVPLMRDMILSDDNNGPYVTGAYIIKTPDGYNKLDGVLKCIEWFMEQEHTVSGESDLVPHTTDRLGWRQLAEDFIAVRDHHPGNRGTMRGMWEWLRKFPYLGDFMAYEIVTDLRHTPLLDQAPDIMTWANPGPGAARGLGRVFHDDKDYWNQHRHKDELIERMQQLLDLSKNSRFWPQPIPTSIEKLHRYTDNCEVDRLLPVGKDTWPAWEMREVEHTLCEFDKYERARLGEGRPRGVYR